MVIPGNGKPCKPTQPPTGFRSLLSSKITSQEPQAPRSAKAGLDLIQHMRADGVKIILIEKLDRLARDLMAQESCIASLQADGFTLKSLNEPDLCSTDPHRKLMRQIMGSFAEYERSLISGRTHPQGRQADRHPALRRAAR